MDNIKEAVFEGLLAAIEYKQKTEVKPTTPVLMGKMIVEFYDLISSMMTREQLEQALSTAMYPVFVEGLPSELTLNEVIKLGRESIKFNMKGALEENQMTLISEKMEPRLTLSSLIYYSPLSGESMSKFMSANLSWYPLERQVKVIDIWNLTIQQASSTQYGKYSEFTMRSRVIESIKVLGLDEYLPTENLADYDSTNLIYIFKNALLKSNCHPIEVIDKLSQLSWYSKDYFDCGKTRLCRAVVNGYRESNDGDNFPEDILEGLVGIIVKLLKPATKLELMEMYPVDVHFNERSIKDDKYYLEYYKSLLLQARSSKRLYKRVLLDVFTCLIKHTNTPAGMVEMHMNHFLDAREKEAAPA